MRNLLLIPVLAVAVACSSATSPEGTVINVTVRDDRGVAVSRMPVTVSSSSGSRVETRTKGDGTVDVRVAAGGAYSISVVPREGYLAGQDPLLKNVSVAMNETATVGFTVQRSAVSTAEPKPWDFGS